MIRNICEREYLSVYPCLLILISYGMNLLGATVRLCV